MEYRPAQKPKKSKGGQELTIMIAIIGFAVALSGGFYLRNIPGPPVRGQVAFSHGVYCCDTGSGQDCKPQTNLSELTYGGQQYALLKSSTTFNDCGKHLRDSGQTFQNNPIVLDVSNEYNSPGSDGCGPSGTDTLADWRFGPKVCFPIPNDELVYVCTANCNTHSNPSCDSSVKSADFYGDGTTVYSVYFRLPDYGVARTSPDSVPTNNGIPDIVKNCNVPRNAWNPNENKQNANAGVPGGLSPTAVQGVLTPLPYPTHHSEQLHTFLFGWPSVSGNGPVQWVRPWCKPAIYLYPDKAENVNVKIAPKGNVLTTIPEYPQGGWDVFAQPDGTISYQNKTYPYLYYEAAMPDSLLTQSTNAGYVVSYDKLSDLFANLLPNLGLNPKETNEFTDYWLKALPSSAYYKITVVPQSLLDQISPLTINPVPQTIIRVSLSFQALDKPDLINPPQLATINRQGFTVVEWGGLFKKDKNHPFTCLQ